MQEPSSYLLVAESLEVLDSALDEYHAAEAILHYAKTPYISNPPKATPNTCTLSKPCITFNCPFLYYPQGANRIWDVSLFFQLNQYCTDLTTLLGDVIRQIVDKIPCANALFMED